MAGIGTIELLEDRRLLSGAEFTLETGLQGPALPQWDQWSTLQEGLPASTDEIAAGVTDAYLQIQGITGGSTHSSYSGWFDVQSYDWGVESDAAGTARWWTLRLEMPVGRGTPELVKEAIVGAEIADARLHVRSRNSLGASELQFEYELERVYVGSLVLSLGPDGDLRQEVSLAFQSGEVTYHRAGKIAASVAFDARHTDLPESFSPTVPYLPRSELAARDSIHDLFLQVPGVSGTATRNGREAWLGLHSFYWGIDSGITISEQGVQRRPTAMELQIFRSADAASPALVELVHMGTPASHITLEAVDSNSGNVPLTLELSPGLATYYDLQTTSRPGAALAEGIGFAYEKIELTTRSDAGVETFESSAGSLTQLRAASAGPAPLLDDPGPGITDGAVFGHDHHAGTGEIYLDYPNVPGDATRSGYEDQIAVEGFSWGLDRPVSLSGGLTRAGVTQGRELTILKGLDRATPVLARRTLDLLHAVEPLTLTYLALGNDGALVPSFELILGGSGFLGRDWVARAGGVDGTATYAEEASFVAPRATFRYLPKLSEVEVNVQQATSAARPQVSAFDLPADAAGGVEFYFSLPGIDGGSTRAGHEGDARLYAWAWSLDGSSIDYTTGVRADSVSVGAFHVSKEMNRATVPLADAVRAGRLFGTAELSMEVADPGGGFVPALVFEFDDVRFNSLDLGIGLDSDLRESSSFAFAGVELRHQASTTLEYLDLTNRGRNVNDFRLPAVDLLARDALENSQPTLAALRLDLPFISGTSDLTVDDFRWGIQRTPAGGQEYRQFQVLTDFGNNAAEAVRQLTLTPLRQPVRLQISTYGQTGELEPAFDIELEGSAATLYRVRPGQAGGPLDEQYALAWESALLEHHPTKSAAYFEMYSSGSSSPMLPLVPHAIQPLRDGVPTFQGGANAYLEVDNLPVDSALSPPYEDAVRLRWFDWFAYRPIAYGSDGRTAFGRVEPSALQFAAAGGLHDLGILRGVLDSTLFPTARLDVTGPNMLGERELVYQLGLSGSQAMAYEQTAADPGIGPAMAGVLTYSEITIGGQADSPDTIPPVVISGSFDFEQAQRVVITFSEDVSASLTAGDLQLINADTGAAVNVTPTLSYAGTTATFTFSPPLPRGNYRAILSAQSVSDAAGNMLTSAYLLEFFVLPGDANRDRKVDFTDFLVLRGNFGRTDDPPFSQADFNYDGKVDFADFLILRGQFGATLPPPPSGSLFAGGDNGDGGSVAVARSVLR